MNANTHEGYLLIADITGYTMYLSASELDHAQNILTALLELLLAHTKPPLVLSRLAGDAVISYGLRGSFFQGQTFLEIIEDTYIAFRKAIEQMVMNNTCHCKACANISSLDLKFFVHYGTFAIQNISDHEELVGSDVNLIHRLLKNHVVEKTGLQAYALYTESAVNQLGIDGLRETLVPLDEQYDYLGTVRVWVQDMQPVWQQKRDSTQVTIPTSQILMQAETEISLAPELVWDFLVEPEHRALIMGADRVDVLHRNHGRISPGSVYQCVHGSHTNVLNILEWKPFERMLMNSTTPIPRVTTLMEFHLALTAGGTCLTQCISRSRGPLPGRLICDLALKSMEKRAIADLAAFKERIEKVQASRVQAST